MKSIKPGRGPSMMGAIMSIAVGIFGVIWTVLAISIGAGLFALFGVVFVIIAIVQTIYNFKNATGENRYSAYDIVDKNEESDPLNDRYGKTSHNPPSGTQSTQNTRSYCPFCGEKVGQTYVFCQKCGSKLS